MTKTLVLLSGGTDSCVAAAHYLDRGDEVGTIAINYGQRHVRELEAASAVAAFYGIPYELVDLRGLAQVLTGSALTDPRVPLPVGHYAAPSMRATVVPNRNMIMLAVAVGTAVAQGYDRVATAVHAGDHPIYPDCRPSFIRAMNLAAGLAVDGLAPATFAVTGPFAHWSKAEIVQHGAMIGAPLHLTWSCYQGGLRHCGLCGTCVERREAFELAAVSDPTDYADDISEFAAP